MRKGFTLVELSIVLVIIGLLIGGILVGQSLVESAQITKFIRQIQQLDVATSNFVTKYKNLPGDTPLMPVAGNGNKILRDSNGGSDFYTGEYMNFWQHLTTTELTDLYTHDNGDGTFPSPSQITPNINAPKAVIGENAVILAQTAVGAIFPDKTNFWHVRNRHIGQYHLFQGNEAAGKSSPLTIKEAFAVDAKFDDGNATTGDVRASDGRRAGQPWNDAFAETGCVLTTDNSKYDIDGVNVGAATRPCALMIKMQVN